MSKPFKKKKQQSLQDIIPNLSLLLLPQSSSTQQSSIVFNRQLIIKCAMFWDSKSRVQRIKSLNLSSMNLEQFEDCQDFMIEQLSTIKLLSLSKNKIIHLQPISILDTLITLNINHNKVYSLAPLEPLVSLQQLYASNNQITSISYLSNLKQLRVINFYNNKISSFDTTIATLSKLPNIQDLDLELNPFYQQDLRAEFITLGILKRFNDKAIVKNQRQSNKKDGVNMSSSCLINPLNMSMMMRASNTSFFNASSKSKKTNRLKDLRQKLQKLEEQYFKIDEQFQEEIVNNVKLKSEFHALSQRVKASQEQKQQNQSKVQEIKLMKRKSKDLKQSLFKIQSKGGLLRELFELEIQLAAPKKAQIRNEKEDNLWVRRFDCDDTIVIEDYSKYLEQDRQIAELLQNNSNTLQQLRRQLSYFY